MSEKKGLLWPQLRPYFINLAEAIREEYADAEKQLLDLEEKVRESLKAYGRVIRSQAVFVELKSEIDRLKDELAEARKDAGLSAEENDQAVEREDLLEGRVEDLMGENADLKAEVKELLESRDQGDAGKVQEQIRESRSELLRWVHKHDLNDETLELRLHLDWLEHAYPKIAGVGS